LVNIEFGFLTSIVYCKNIVDCFVFIFQVLGKVPGGWKIKLACYQDIVEQRKQNITEHTNKQNENENYPHIQ
jgi:hypothetical protein